MTTPTIESLLSTRGARPDRTRGFGPPAVLGPGAVGLAGGNPGADALPLAEIARASAELTADPDALAAALSYQGPQGGEDLRAWIGRHEGVDPARVVITNGAFHGLALLFDALLDPGDAVVIEEPTYSRILRNLQHYDVDIEHLVLEADGSIGRGLDDLEARLVAGLRPKLLYTIPDFQNPTGAVVPAAVRARLVELAERYGFVLVSDNAYVDLPFDGTAVIPDLDLVSDRVVHVRTFSKVLGPGLRLGWLVLPEWLVGPVTSLRANHDFHSSGLSQAIATRVIGADGAYAAITRRAGELYGRRHDLAVRLLGEGITGGIEPAHRTGGIFLWATLRDGDVDLGIAQRIAREETGGDAVLGRYFYRDRPEDDRRSLRIGISQVDERDLADGIARLVAAIEDPRARRTAGTIR